MAKKKSTKKRPEPSAEKREVRELSESELEQISGGAAATTKLADAKHGMADAKRSIVDISGGSQNSGSN